MGFGGQSCINNPTIHSFPSHSSVLPKDLVAHSRGDARGSSLRVWEIWQLFGSTGVIIKKGEKRGEGEEEEKGRKKKREKRKKWP